MSFNETLSPEVLDKIWESYVDEKLPSLKMRQKYLRWTSHTYYQSVSRNMPIAVKFEEWLFTNGLRVFQKDGRRYLHAHDEVNATLFLLKYT